MVGVLASSAVDSGFISGVMVSVLVSSVVDRGFIGGVMVGVLASSAVDRGFELQSDQTKDYEIAIFASPLSIPHQGERAKSCWLGIRKMCPSCVYPRTVVSVS